MLSHHAVVFLLTSDFSCQFRHFLYWEIIFKNSHGNPWQLTMFSHGFIMVLYLKSSNFEYFSFSVTFHQPDTFLKRSPLQVNFSKLNLKKTPLISYNSIFLTLFSLHKYFFDHFATCDLQRTNSLRFTYGVVRHFNG